MLAVVVVVVVEVEVRYPMIVHGILVHDVCPIGYGGGGGGYQGGGGYNGGGGYGRSFRRPTTRSLTFISQVEAINNREVEDMAAEDMVAEDMVEEEDIKRLNVSLFACRPPCPLPFFAS